MEKLNIVDFGADAAGQRLSTVAIQTAIDSAKPGDTIVVPPGRYLTGALFLKSYLTLELQIGSVLLGSRVLTDYPIGKTRVAGIDMDWPAGVINILHCREVCICGGGIIDGQGAVWWHKFWGDDRQSGMLAQYSQRGLRWVVDYDCQRPRNVVVYRSEQIELSGFTSRESGFWNIHLCYSQQLHLHHLQVENSGGPSTDGIDIDSSQQVVVEHCRVFCNDDNICVKSGRGAQAQRIGATAKDIVIRECELLRGSGITLGSETSGGIEQVTVENIRFNGTGVGFRIKSARNRGGFIRNIRVSRLYMTDVHYPFMLLLNWFPAYSYGSVITDESIPAHWQTLAQGVDGEAGLTRVEGITISQVRSVLSCSEAFSRAFFIEGNAESPIDNLHFNDITLTAQEFGKIAGVRNLRLDNLQVSARQPTCSKNDIYER